ncbi:hypothetical protein Megvenef_01390 [Candidatus Megaera venefica]|uniref:DUF4252 domain-containing protein n=1 Tax=Candidatus Megaera venefica TaxID=2055910 RepID=A0ABU5NE08_9RICK|nr:hypothetical protein [Candidatus Megaera venefica]MEA0971412.1 hypothetical protein [Candidatus Megaera venefica]
MTRLSVQSNIISFIFGIFWYFSLGSYALATTRDNPEWKETISQFELIKDSVENLETEGTVLGVLLQQSGRNINELLEDDKKTLVSFAIKYKAPVKLKNEAHAKERTITQYGLYRMLDSRIQSYLEKHRGDNLKIMFAQSDPILIQFIVGKEAISAPVLLTDTIDKKWQKQKKSQ